MKRKTLWTILSVVWIINLISQIIALCNGVPANYLTQISSTAVATFAIIAQTIYYMEDN